MPPLRPFPGPGSGAPEPARSFAVLLALALCVLGAACASPRVAVEFDPDTDFSAYTTFGWVDPAELPPDAPRAPDPAVDELIRRTVEQALQERGYRKNPGQTDFLIVYRGVLETWQEMVPLYSPGGAVRSMILQSYEEGTLVLDVYDAGSKRLVWRGSVTEAFDDRRRAIEGIERLVRTVVARFPPPQ